MTRRLKDRRSDRAGPAEQRTPDAVRQRIVDAARRCFEQYGIAKTTMQDIANEAGVTRRTVYNHFDNQDSILARISEIETDRLAEDVGHVIQRPLSTQETITQGFIAATRLTATRPILRRTMRDLGVVKLSVEPNSPIHRKIRARWSHFFDAAISRGDLAEGLDIDTMVIWLTFAHSTLHSLSYTKSGDFDRLEVFVRDFIAEPLIRTRAFLAKPPAATHMVEPFPDIWTGGRPTAVQEHILLAARNCFDAKERQHVTLMDIAVSAGVARSTVYTYFRDKEDLYDQLTDYELRNALERIEQDCVGQPADFAELAPLWMTAFVRMAQANPYLRATMIGPEKAIEGGWEGRDVNVRHWMALIGETRPVMAENVSQTDAANWLTHAEALALLLAETMHVSDETLRPFVRRFIVEPLLPRSR